VEFVILSVFTEKFQKSNVGFDCNIKITASGHLSMLRKEHAAIFPQMLIPTFD
jgi:hypothetical protein